MKKIALFLALVFALSVLPAAFAAEETVSFTDSVGRTVEVPKNITKVAVSGPMTQIVLFALCPDKLVGISNEWDATAEQYLDVRYLELPVLGQLYGGKGEMNPEVLIASGAEVVIDVGEPKGSVAEDLDALTEQTGIPFVHITATTGTMGEAYRKLGELLGMPEEAETLASYCERVYNGITALMSNVLKKTVVYIPDGDSLSVIAKGSYHAEIIDLLAENAAVVDDPSSKGTGNKIDFEQLLLWDPEYIVFAPGTLKDAASADASWQLLSAISEGKYTEVPATPYNWLGFPPSVQRLLGMQWLAKYLYPEATEALDMREAVKEYYSLFYHAELSDAQVEELLKYSPEMLETESKAA